MTLIENMHNAYELGFYDLEECFDRIVDGYTDANGGHMNSSELAEMVDDVEEFGWWDMAHFMQGYFWGACIDDENELKGERRMLAEINR